MLRRVSKEELARGIVLVLFGVFLFLVPGGFFAVLLFLFGIAVLIDGLLAFAELLRGTDPLGRPRWVLRTEGVAGVAAGSITLLWPGITAFILLAIVGVWAIVTGGAEFAAGMKVERGSSLRGLRISRGALGVALGFLLLMRPMAGASALMVTIGLLAIGVGITTIGSALAARRLGAGVGRDRMR